MVEDKKCRICGFADAENINIFGAGQQKNIQQAISAVFPIILYRDDPLPKHICKKCSTTVLSNYHSIQKVMKLQNEWIHNVRKNEPKNDYVQVLDMINASNKATKNALQIAGIELISDESLNRIFLSNLKECTSAKKQQTTLPLNGQPTTDTYTLAACHSNREDEAIGRISSISDADMDGDEDEEDNLSLAKIAAKVKVKCSYCYLEFDTSAKLAVHQVVHLSVRMPKLFTKKYLNKNSRRGRLITVQERQSIRCLNCWRVFDDNKRILEHWSLGKCDFYCQICGEEYTQSPKMLREHIQTVHGISFKSLKMQHERIVRRNYRIAEMPPHTKQPRIDERNEKPTLERSKANTITQYFAPKAKATDNSEMRLLHPSYCPEKPVACRICRRMFQNFKACNSHMRAHKAPYGFGESSQILAAGSDAYREAEYKNDDESSYNLSLSLSQNSSTTSQTAAITSSANRIEQTIKTDPTTYTEFEKPQSSHSPGLLSPSSTQTDNTKSATPIRGIRMKFVTRRNDLNGINPGIKVKSLQELQCVKIHEMSQRQLQQQPPPPPQIVAPLPVVSKVQSLTPQSTLIKNEPMDVEF